MITLSDLSASVGFATAHFSELAPLLVYGVGTVLAIVPASVGLVWALAAYIHRVQISALEERRHSEIAGLKGEIQRYRDDADKAFGQQIRRGMGGASFLDIDRFRPKNLSGPGDPSTTTWDNDRYQALSDRKVWSEREMPTEAIFHEWFGESFIENPVLKEGYDEILSASGSHSCVWHNEAKRVHVDAHTYIKIMYPFIIVSREPLKQYGKLPPDQIGTKVFFSFMKWLDRFERADAKTFFKIDHIQKYEEIFYLSGHFIFTNITVGGAEYRSYYLYGEVFVFCSHDSVYTVLTGVPTPRPHSDDFTSVTRWLESFQLGSQ